MSASKKLNWLLILQGWTMLWVVIGHAFLGSLNAKDTWPGYVRVLMDVAYSFHMPLFMLISGYLFYRTRIVAAVSGGGNSWTYQRTISDKVVRLLIPFVFFTFFAFALKIALPGEMARGVNLNMTEVLRAFLFPYDNPMREMWFIATLFWMFLLMPVWQFVLSKDTLEWVALLLLLVLHFLRPEIELLCIGRFCKLAVWFYLGLIISKESIETRYFQKYVHHTIIVGMIMYALGFYIHHFFTTLGGIVFSFGLAFLLDKYLPFAFTGFRNYTYQIFLLGIFAQMFVKIAYRHFPIIYIVAYVVCIIAGIYVPVIISKILQKLNWSPALYCIGLKPRKRS